jgi:hypothetical protein
MTLSERFLLVHHLVTSLESVVERFRRRRIVDRRTDADRERKRRLRLRRVVFDHSLLNPTDDHIRALAPGVGGEYDELIASQPSDDVGLAKRRRDQPGGVAN